MTDKSPNPVTKYMKWTNYEAENAPITHSIMAAAHARLKTRPHSSITKLILLQTPADAKAMPLDRALVMYCLLYYLQGIPFMKTQDLGAGMICSRPHIHRMVADLASPFRWQDTNNIPTAWVEDDRLMKYTMTKYGKRIFTMQTVS